MTNYEFTKVSPQQLRLQVRYTKDGSPDYWINFQITDFNESNLHEVAQGGAGKAEEFWQSIDQLPEEVTPEIMIGTAKPRVYVNAPDHDKLTHNAAFEWIETEDAITQTWTVTEKTDDEKTQVITEWRDRTQVTPRQARLELAKRGQLANIDTIIASLPADQQEAVQIEWEYAVSIERSSPWVIQLGSALGLDEVGLDELFKAAGLL